MQFLLDQESDLRLNQQGSCNLQAFSSNGISAGIRTGKTNFESHPDSKMLGTFIRMNIIIRSINHVLNVITFKCTVVTMW